MRFSKKQLVFIIAFVVMVAAGYFYNEFNRTTATIEDRKPMAKLNVASIIDQFEKDETIVD